MTRRASPPCVCVVDSREQLPLAPFVYRTRAGIAERALLPIITRGLRSGDYSIEGMDAWVAVERKSQVDLWGTIFGVDDEPTALGEARRHEQAYHVRERHVRRRPREDDRGAVQDGGGCIMTTIRGESVYFMGLLPTSEGPSDCAWTTQRGLATRFAVQRAAEDTARALKTGEVVSRWGGDTAVPA